MCQSLNVSTPSIVEQILSRKRSRVQAFESKENRMVYQEVCKSIQNTKVQSTQARARKLHKKYSATINKADVSKWLTGEVIKAEKDIHRMFGAIAYAEIQLRESVCRNGCVLCRRRFKSDCDEIRFKQSFRKKITKTLEFVKTSRANELRLKYTSQLGKLKAFPVNGFVVDRPIAQYKRGKIDALRTQKIESLQTKRCAVCERSFNGRELCRFLSTMDRRVNNLQGELAN
uniref:Uncharacterized protein n=2 Tax=Sar TaxID=2698737 RepID=A0A7S3PS51_9STRA|mmetsp:Transcript_5863/g.7391  ORF Transcript_5863/g.7391 Transcript_5863/m.7391 type:complete len:230 (+) Transcript_5863:366-1055(+)|eukprot:CAMPEP_0204848526 /NCGR_PEP_ID=MMETSP1347-20130617/4392_1 /ASSEMBLY_ACC=CAM_ASM_000690 /TAXON_ID=215587 /ORGANISM="Aplanochytrium stocchinoi, Strain GSBS06" /LENGTH=229 /DNA_ID=CAMNT_0051990163 /DNA_START=140 /DNA_END=829 /DNA_ORIENTATION=+